jgi:hypothetical protein
LQLIAGCWYPSSLANTCEDSIHLFLSENENGQNLFISYLTAMTLARFKKEVVVQIQKQKPN